MMPAKSESTGKGILASLARHFCELIMLIMRIIKVDGKNIILSVDTKPGSRPMHPFYLGYQHDSNRLANQPGNGLIRQSKGFHAISKAKKRRESRLFKKSESS
jgi:hypothetical protein